MYGMRFQADRRALPRPFQFAALFVASLKAVAEPAPLLRTAAAVRGLSAAIAARALPVAIA